MVSENNQIKTNGEGSPNTGSPINILFQKNFFKLIYIFLKDNIFFGKFLFQTPFYRNKCVPPSFPCVNVLEISTIPSNKQKSPLLGGQNIYQSYFGGPSKLCFPISRINLLTIFCGFLDAVVTIPPPPKPPKSPPLLGPPK